jgi:septum site-determining protein MinD
LGYFTIALIDADVTLKQVAFHEGLARGVVYTAIDVLSGECSINKALVKDKRQPNLMRLVAPENKNKEAISPDDMKKLVAELDKQFDFIFIDSPASIKMGFRSAICPAQEAIIVTTPEMAAVRDADRVVGLLESEDIKKIHLIVNRIKPKMIQLNQMIGVEDIVDLLVLPLLGIVPDDERIVISTNEREPLVLEKPDSIPGRAFKNIAQRLDGKDVPFLDLMAADDNLWTRFISRFRNKK